MRSHIKVFAAITAAVLTGFAVPVQSAPIFTDGFDAGLPINDPLNVVPPGWTVTGGTVDHLANGNQWNIQCVGNTGGCVDLDGSSNDAGLMSNGDYALQSGQTYALTAMVSGNQRNGDSESLTFGFLNAGDNSVLNSQVVSNIAGSTFNTITLLFTAASNVSARIFFEAAGGDNVGPILDNVSLTAVPLPAAGWLLLSGLVGLVAVRRRGAAV